MASCKTNALLCDPVRHCGVTRAPPATLPRLQQASAHWLPVSEWRCRQPGSETGRQRGPLNGQCVRAIHGRAIPGLAKPSTAQHGQCTQERRRCMRRESGVSGIQRQVRAVESPSDELAKPLLQRDAAWPICEELRMLVSETINDLADEHLLALHFGWSATSATATPLVAARSRPPTCVARSLRSCSSLWWSTATPTCLASTSPRSSRWSMRPCPRRRRACVPECSLSMLIMLLPCPINLEPTWCETNYSAIVQSCMGSACMQRLTCLQHLP